MPNGVAQIQALRTRALAILSRGQPAAMLLARLSVGLLFLSTGWGKVHDIPKVTGFFESLGIPMPGLNAVVVAYSELLCGSALIVGLFTRLATVPLIVSMIVALLTAKRSDIHGIFDLVGADEFTYLCMLVVIAFVGPGRWSADTVVAKKLEV
jgi:putative oxidoreductase